MTLKDFSEYLVDAQRYDAGVNQFYVEKIVKYLGIALRAKETSLVSCSDSKETDRIINKWCIKKLGEKDHQHCNQIVNEVCQIMKADRFKERVTFYYLVAKKLDQLDKL